MAHSSLVKYIKEWIGGDLLTSSLEEKKEGDPERKLTKLLFKKDKSAILATAQIERGYIIAGINESKRKKERGGGHRVRGNLYSVRPSRLWKNV